MLGGVFSLDLSVDKQNLLDQLGEIFHPFPASKIREICDECHWDENLCIEKLSALRRNEHQSSGTAASFSSVLQIDNGANKVTAFETVEPWHQHAKMDLPYAYKSVYNNIRMGYKVLILMRGAPGSGKSHLAKSIVQKLLPGRDWKDFILSADDYFFDSLGRYRYNAEQLDNAHKYCQTRAREKTSLGWSPIFIDNTNIKLWEMMPYVQVAVQNGYLVEIMEPVTSWRQSASKLASKNVHNVTRAKIQRMLDSYEVCTTRDLLSLLKGTAYSNPVPQLRTYPPPAAMPLPLPPLLSKPSTSTKDEMDTADSNQCITEDLMQFEKESTPLFESTNIWQNCAETPPPPKSPGKNQRKKESDEDKQQETETCIPQATSSWNDSIITANPCETMAGASPPLFPRVPAAWQPFEQEASSFWGVDINPANSCSTNTEPMNTDQNETCGLLQLLKEGVKSINVPNKEKLDMLDQSEFVRHKVGCENENQSFVALRQIYPNRPIDELWDLFVKCSGSVDWAVDILLRDVDSASSDFLEVQDNYICGCDELMGSVKDPLFDTKILLPEVNVKPQRSKPARNRAIPSQFLEAKEAIEKSFVLSDDLYSSHVNKIRSKRNGREDANNRKTLVDIQVQTDYEENDSISEDSVDGAEIIEITLGEELVSQLLSKFQFETPTLTVPEKYKTNVFMPKSLARELLLLWMESVYNQIEEQRQTTLKEDEEFARLLKNPKYENCKQSPENIKELLDMEFAWMVYKGEQEELSAATNPTHQHPTDLASHLTQMKLCELFPNIPKDTLLDILAAHNNKFSETVETLKDSLQQPAIDHKTVANLLMEKARDEDEKLEKEAEQQDNQYAATQTEQPSTPRSTRSRSLSPEEAKRLALKEFEETRNYAIHHIQLRAECYHKAKEAIQRGNSGVAAYYSNIANLHKKKIDVYNNRAANCIIEVHDLTQNNPDFIDLHYLHVIEAVGCLDIFIDKHISKLRSQFRSYKYVFIITGRGLHSTGGVSTIKTRVKSRLKERGLKWTEVNPGLLKVKIFSATKFAKNL